MLKRFKDSLLLGIGVIGVATIVGYGVYQSESNYQMAKRIQQTFLEVADTDNDGITTLSEQVKYLKSHGIKLQPAKIGGKEVTTLEGFPLHNGNLYNYWNARLSTAGELSKLEKNLVIGPEDLTSSETLSNSR